MLFIVMTCIPVPTGVSQMVPFDPLTSIMEREDYCQILERHEKELVAQLNGEKHFVWSAGTKHFKHI